MLGILLAGDDASTVDVASCPRDTHFLCDDNSACVPHTWLCDSANDCDDHSDETAAAGCSGTPQLAASIELFLQMVDISDVKKHVLFAVCFLLF